jgi:soluble P-type ATPase
MSRRYYASSYQKVVADLRDRNEILAGVGKEANDIMVMIAFSCLA